MAKLEGILFDNDGTLVDTHDIILASFRHCTREVLGRTVPDDVLMRKVGQPLRVQMRDYSDDPAVQEELLRVYREHNATIHDERIRAFPHVAEGLQKLASTGMPLGVVTAKLRSTAWHGLEIVNLASHFSCCVGAEDCELHKPHPDPILMGCRMLGVKPQNCLYVGDSPYDIQAGKSAGCMTAAALWGMFSAERLRVEMPDFECADFDALVDTVGGIG